MKLENTKRFFDHKAFVFTKKFRPNIALPAQKHLRVFCVRSKWMIADMLKRTHKQ
jgi:hypothetical protein